MKSNPTTHEQRGFTLMETVIAIGVLAVLLTGFMVVFIPAADGIKKSISAQEANRLVSILEQELTNLRPGDADKFKEGAVAVSTGFDKGFFAIWKSTGVIASTDGGDPKNALLVYQYRGKTTAVRTTTDGSPEPMVKIDGKAGDSYTLVPMMRRKSDALFLEDLPAIEGSVFLVKCAQMVYTTGGLETLPIPADGKTRGSIYDPALGSVPTTITDPAAYPDSLIAFTAEFYTVPSKAASFFSGGAFTDFYLRSVKPVFTRNIAIRR